MLLRGRSYVVFLLQIIVTIITIRRRQRRVIGKNKINASQIFICVFLTTTVWAGHLWSPLSDDETETNRLCKPPLVTQLGSGRGRIWTPVAAPQSRLFPRTPQFAHKQDSMGRKAPAILLTNVYNECVTTQFKDHYFKHGRNRVLL